MVAYCINLTEIIGQWWWVVIMVMNLQVPYVGNFVTS